MLVRSFLWKGACALPWSMVAGHILENSSAYELRRTLSVHLRVIRSIFLFSSVDLSTSIMSFVN